MSVLVDTSVWSLALRRDRPADAPAVETLRRHVEQGDVVLIGSILQEVLQGFRDAARTRRLLEHLAQFPLLSLHRGDYVFAATSATHAGRRASRWARSTPRSPRRRSTTAAPCSRRTRTSGASPATSR